MIARLNRFFSSRNPALLVFTLAVVLPGIALALVGLRTVWQERLSSENQVRERLGLAADRAGSDLAQDMQWWQESLNAISPSPAPDWEAFPQQMRYALAMPGAAVLLIVQQDGIRAIPPGQLLYSLAGGTDAGNPPPEVLAADNWEIQRGEYAKALEICRRALSENRDPRLRPWLLQRLARIQRKAGLRDEAMRSYHDLARMTGAMLGALPADLIAGYENCSLISEGGPSEALVPAALDFHRSLVSGKWQLEKVRYQFYSSSARSWLESRSRLDDYQLLRLEEQKLALSQAAETLLALLKPEELPPDLLASDTGHLLAFWRRGAAPSSVFGLLLSAGYVRSFLWPRIFRNSSGQEIEFALVAPNGKRIHPILDSSATGPSMRDSLAVSRSFQAHGHTWQIEAWPLKPDALRADLKRRQRLYLGMLILMMASLVFGILTSARTLKKQLEVARLKSDFVSAVTHEFRSPLTGIRQLAEMLVAGRVPSEERRAQYYGMILHETNRLSGLVENVLGFARITEKTNQYRFEKVDTCAWLREMTESFRQSPAAQGVEIEVIIPENLPPLRIDREALAMAVGNLLDNAINYSPDRKGVRLEAEAAGGFVTISVQDEGAGISPEDQSHIFERFYRGKDERTRRIYGTGLGLSLV